MLTQIDAHASVTLDSNGAGRVSLGPPSGTRWALDLANVSVVTAAGGTPTASSTCTLYRGSTSGPIQQVDVAQFTGNGAASGKVRGVPYFPGQVLWAVWSGGDAGAVATLQVYGQQGTRSDPPFESAPPGEGFPSIPALLIVGNPGAGHIIITSDVPPELTTFYTTAPHGALSVTSAAILIYPEAGVYFYLVTGKTPAGDFLGFGSVAGTTVTEGFYVENDPGTGVFYDFSPISMAFGSFLSVGATFGSATFPGSTLSFTGSSVVNFGSDGKGDMQWHGHTLPRGIVNVGTNTAVQSGIGTSLTSIIVSDTQGSFPTGRAYRMHVHVPLVNSVAAGDVVVRVVQTNGTVLRAQQTYLRSMALGGIITYDESFIFVNTSGATITLQDIKAQVATTGTANLATSVSGAAPGRFEIEDIGPASDFPNAPSMA